MRSIMDAGKSEGQGTDWILNFNKYNEINFSSLMIKNIVFSRDLKSLYTIRIMIFQRIKCFILPF